MLARPQAYKSGLLTPAGCTSVALANGRPPALSRGPRCVWDDTREARFALLEALSVNIGRGWGYHGREHSEECEQPDAERNRRPCGQPTQKRWTKDCEAGFGTSARWRVRPQHDGLAKHRRIQVPQRPGKRGGDAYPNEIGHQQQRGKPVNGPEAEDGCRDEQPEQGDFGH